MKLDKDSTNIGYGLATLAGVGTIKTTLYMDEDQIIEDINIDVFNSPGLDDIKRFGELLLKNLGLSDAMEINPYELVSDKDTKAIVLFIDSLNAAIMDFINKQKDS